MTPTMTPVPRSALLRYRLSRLGLGAQESAVTTTDVVERIIALGGRFLAMQAQDFPASRWAIGLRVPGATDAHVREAFAAGALVRSWPMRSTLHVVPGEDIGWMQALTAARILGASAQRRRELLELDLATIERSRQIAHEVMAGGVGVTRDEFVDALTARGLALKPEWRYHLVWFLAQTGTLCFGPVAASGEHLLVLVDEWIPEPRHHERDDALGELARRYVRTHGPVTLKDFAWWTGLPQRDLKVGLKQAGDELTSVVGEDGTEYWVPAASVDELFASAAEQAAMTGPHVMLLPAFDEILTGYTDRTLSVDADHTGRYDSARNGSFKRIVVQDGRLVGLWKVAPIRKTMPQVRVTIIPFDPDCQRRLNTREARRSRDAAAEAYATFLGANGAEVTVAEPA